MNPPSRLHALRATLRELGPLRYVAAYTAIVPTAGMFVMLASLDALRLATPAGPWVAFGAATGAVALAVGAVVLPPSAAVLGASYCLGGPMGTVAGALGVAIGSTVTWRLLGAALPSAFLVFLRARPRVVAVQRLSAGSPWHGCLGVACLRSASMFPLSVGTLMLAATTATCSRVLLGTLLGTLPLALLAGIAGDGLRAWRAAGTMPPVPVWILAAAGAVVFVTARRAARRRWRAMGAPA